MSFESIMITFTVDENIFSEPTDIFVRLITVNKLYKYNIKLQSVDDIKQLVKLSNLNIYEDYKIQNFNYIETFYINEKNIKLCFDVLNKLLLRTKMDLFI